MPAEPQRVQSDFFVGRQTELERLHNFVAPDAPNRILSVYTDGLGGVGKTKLLLQFQIDCQQYPASLICVNELIDFYHADAQTRLGVMERLVENLAPDAFPNFKAKLQEYQQEQDLGRISRLIEEITDRFWQDYEAFAQKAYDENKVIVLLFDSYEYIQSETTSESSVQANSESSVQAEATEFSRWLEREFFARFNTVSANTRIIVAGRHPLTDLSPDPHGLEKLQLGLFSLDDARNFWNQCLVEGVPSQELMKFFKSEEVLERLYQLTNGQPIFLALVMDYFRLDNSLPEELLEIIGWQDSLVDDNNLKRYRATFETHLIRYIFDSPDKLMRYMFVAYRRMDFALLSHLDGISEEEGRQHLDALSRFSFIKEKQDGVLLLHDEMRRLINREYYQAYGVENRQHIATRLVEYYDGLLDDNTLSKTEIENYRVEQLDYAFMADPSATMTERFPNLFETAMDDGNNDYADILLRTARNYYRENRRTLPYPHPLTIDFKQVKYYIDGIRDLEKAKSLLDSIKGRFGSRKDWPESDCESQWLYLVGQVAFWNNKYDEALEHFDQAARSFHLLSDDYQVYEIQNFIGYTYYRTSQFAQAEAYFSRSRRGFYNLLDSEHALEKYRPLLQRIQNSLGNSAMLYHYVGLFDRSVRYADLALNIVPDLPENSKEIARSHGTVAHNFAFSGRSRDANDHVKQASVLLRSVRDRILQGRLLISQAWLGSRTNDLATIIEFYRAEELAQVVQTAEELRKAIDYTEDAIRILGDQGGQTPIYKELADAYFIQGEIYMIMPATADSLHFEKAEAAFLAALESATKSQFEYRRVDALQSLSVLYYFWNGSKGVSEAQIASNTEKLKEYADQFDALENRTAYPNLLARHEINQGDIQFDKIYLPLREGQGLDIEEAIQGLQQAFTHYVGAVIASQAFNQERYYLALRIVHDRLYTLIELQNFAILRDLDEIAGAWRDKTNFDDQAIEEVYQNAQLSINPELKIRQIEELVKEVNQNYISTGDLWRTLLANGAILNAYEELAPKKTAYYENLIVQLDSQSVWYRMLNDEYHAEQANQQAHDLLLKITDPTHQMLLAGRVDSIAGELMYRRAEYQAPLEFNLRGELEQVRRKFEESEGEGGLDAAEQVLLKGLNKIEQAIKIQESEQGNAPRDFYQKLSTAYFRLGELRMLNERFLDESILGAFTCFQKAVDIAQDYGYDYRYYDAMQSYVTAFYFASDMSNISEEYQLRQAEYTARVDRVIDDPQNNYPLIYARLRITQGDMLFSECFEFGGLNQAGEPHFKKSEDYSRRKIRQMLQYYVEACNLKLRYNERRFERSLLILQRRIRLIPDLEALADISSGLINVWDDQDQLQDRIEELDTLRHWIKIRELVLKKQNEENKS